MAQHFSNSNEDNFEFCQAATYKAGQAVLRLSPWGVKLTAGALILCIGATTSASGQFQTASPEKFPASGFLECGILELAPRDRDNDPIYKIQIGVGLDEAGGQTLKTMTVTHTSVFGKKYTRDEQYTGGTLKQMPGRLEVLWSGTWKKNPAVVMNGRLWNDLESGRWFYSERQTRNGANQMQMLSGCHSSDGD